LFLALASLRVLLGLCGAPTLITTGAQRATELHRELP